jgi:fumarate reductase subunit C
MRNIKIKSQFTAGFISAFLLLLSIAIISKATAWFRNNSQPQAFFEFLNTPVLSILDIFTGLVMLLIVFVVATAPAWLPHRDGRE